jgi:hypothetical protein
LSGKRLLVAIGLSSALGTLVGFPVGNRFLAWRAIRQRLDAIESRGAAGEASPCAPGLPLLGTISTRTTTTATLASWQTVGGCGAGAASGSGAGIKWIGRGASGGLLGVQCLLSYARLGDGRQDYAGSVQVTRDLSDRWNIGVALPYLFKQRDGFPRPDLRLSNQGPGDLEVLVTRRFGATRETSLTLWTGFPTGTAAAEWQVGSQSAPLPQDLQLGAGRPTASLVLDHVIDHLWGLTVLGATANYRGGRNGLGNDRAPNGNLYGYLGYLLGPLVPALGLTVTGATASDVSLGQSANNPLLTLSLNASVEWSTSWVALLTGFSLPYGRRGSSIALQPWIVGMGATFAPF